MADPRGYVFADAEVRRIAKAVRYVERLMRGEHPFGITTPRGDEPKLGKTNAALGRNASGTINIYGGTTAGSETDTTQDITAYNRGPDLPTDTWVIIENNGAGWYVAWAASGPVLLGKTDALHNKAASGTISVWTGTPGSETDSTVNITACNRFANVASGKWVLCAHNGYGWYLTAAEC